MASTIKSFSIGEKDDEGQECLLAIVDYSNKSMIPMSQIIRQALIEWKDKHLEEQSGKSR